MRKRKVAVLGATGMVGQIYIQMLADHPWFDLVAIAASERSAGKTYAEAAKWYRDTPIPTNVAGMKLISMTADAIKGAGVEIVFSAVPSDAALAIEKALVEAGLVVVADTAVHRMDPRTPLVVPEVNHAHLQALNDHRHPSGGLLVSCANCSTTGLVATLAPLQRAFGIERVFVTTMQAVSGAGYDGVPSMQILDNLVPFIKNEEEKIERETKKILGAYENGEFHFADIAVHAQCTRIPVIDGHSEAVFVELASDATPEAVREAFTSFPALDLPSAPIQPVIVRSEPDRPQPRLDRMAGNGMATTVGRIRVDGRMLRYNLLSHNTIRGAAGNAILIAELLVQQEFA